MPTRQKEVAEKIAFPKWFRKTYWEIVGKVLPPTDEELTELAELTKKRLTK